MSSWVDGRHVAILNWRDVANPQAGGAEHYAHQVARRMVAAGAKVTMVTARAAGQSIATRQDDVDILRVGGQYRVYSAALEWLRGHRADIDAVVDCQNGIPFFSPLAVGNECPVLLLLHHVHQQQFRMRFARAGAALGRFLEGPATRAIYSDRPVVAVSPSSRAAARSELNLTGPIYVIPNGIDLPCGAIRSPKRVPEPKLVCVGRLVAHKRVHLVLDAVAQLRNELPTLTLDIVGDGPDRTRLERRAIALGLTQEVHFWGRVDDKTRNALISRAWLSVNASMGEGWGLVVLEANALGVPTVAFDVPGLRDAIEHQATGWLIADGESLAAAIAAVLPKLANPETARAIGNCGRRWARAFSWDRTTERLTDLLAAESARAQRHLPQRPSIDLVLKQAIRAV